MFCNCGAAENNFYASMMAAENACATGDGYGSCMAIQLGFVSKIVINKIITAVIKNSGTKWSPEHHLSKFEWSLVISLIS